MLKRLFMLFVVVCVGGTGAYVARRMTTPKPTPMAEAMALFENKDVVGAQTIARTVIRSEPRNAEAHLLLGRTGMILADWNSVEKEAKALRALRYDRSIVTVMLARAYMMQEKYADLLADIPGVAPRPEEQAINQAMRSWAYLALDDRPQAQAGLDAAAAIAPNEPQVLQQGARLAFTRDDYPAALAKLDGVLRQRPASVEALLLKSQVLEAKGDVAGAVAELDTAVGLSPSSPQLRLARARLLMDRDKDEEAQADVNMVLQLAPHDNQASFYNAWLLMRRKQYADAAGEFDKLGTVLNQFPRGYLYRAQAAVALGNVQSALESLDRLLKLRPADMEGVHLAAQLSLSVQQPSRAVGLLVPALAKVPNDALARDLLGRAYFMLGRTRDAVASFQQATLLAPDIKEYAAHLSAAKTDFGTAPLPAEPTIDGTVPAAAPSQ